MQENIKLAGLNEDEIQKILKKNDCEKIKDVLLLTISQDGQGYLQIKNKPAKTFQSKRLVSQ